MTRTTSLLTGSLVAAAVALGGFALWSTTTPAPAIAQGGAIDPALYEQASQLQTRIQHLENQFQQRSTIPAPFRVVDNAGLELATIQRGAGGQPELRVGPAIQLGYIDGGPAVKVVNGAQQAALHIEGDSARLFASADGVNGFHARSSPSGEHLASIFAGGNEVANLGVLEGRRAAVRLFNEQGTPLAALGIDGSGIGQLRTVDPDGTSGVTAGGNGHGGGNVVLWKSGQEVMSMRTPEGVPTFSVYNNGGTPVGFVTTTSDAGLVTVNGASGTEVVHFTFRGTGGSFCSRMRNGNAVCLLPLP